MEASQASSRRHCYNEDDGLASLSELEAGKFPKHSSVSNPRLLCCTRRTTLRHLPSFEDHRLYFLDACFGCKKSLSVNKDIYMYRGDTPFCSEECRQEQIEKDEAMERVSSMQTRKKEQKILTSSRDSKGLSSHKETVAAA